MWTRGVVPLRGIRSLRFRLAALLILPLIGCLIQLLVSHMGERLVEELRCRTCGGAGVRVVPSAYGIVDLPEVLRLKDTDCSVFLRRHFGAMCREHRWATVGTYSGAGTVAARSATILMWLSSDWSDIRRRLFEHWASEAPQDLRRWMAYLLDPQGACPDRGYLCGGCHRDDLDLYQALLDMEGRCREAGEIGWEMDVSFSSVLPDHVAEVWPVASRRLVVPY